MHVLVQTSVRDTNIKCICYANCRANSRRAVLDDEARATTSTPAQAEASTVEGGNDHQVVQDPALMRN